MDGNRFDDITRRLAVNKSRRGVLRTLAGMGGGALLSLTGRAAAAAGCKGTGRACSKGDQCCSGNCAPRPGKTAVAKSGSICCPAGQTQGPTGTCIPLRAQGAQCTAGGQCLSGYCTDGVCCNAACGGQCEACNVPGSVGSCEAVFGDPVGGRAACDGSGVCTGACDGVERSECTYPGDVVTCGDGTCIGQCDGSGGCTCSGP